MFITSSKVICRVVKGIREEKEGETVGKAEDQMGSEL